MLFGFSPALCNNSPSIKLIMTMIITMDNMIQHLGLCEEMGRLMTKAFVEKFIFAFFLLNTLV